MKADAKSAAQYVRMSTDRQDLSPLLQKDAIAAFAEAHGFSVVRTFEDEGKSGVRITNRPGLRSLLREVESNPEFTAILVYDVSRWGRFQDVDAGAYYEYHCRLRGIEVIYVAETFGREPLPINMLAKSVKRVMAAEYSRELASKSRAGQLRVVLMGFHMGPLPPFGYRRESVSADQSRHVALDRGELKRALTDRIRWVLGPRKEVQLVRQICSYYAHSKLDIPDIAAIVGGAGWRTAKNRVVTPGCIKRLLTNEALIGNFVWGTGETERRLIESVPTRRNGSVPRIIDDATWKAIQARIATRDQTVFFRRGSAKPRPFKPTTQLAPEAIDRRAQTSATRCRQARDFGRALSTDLNASGQPAGYESLTNVLCIWGALIRIRLIWPDGNGDWTSPQHRDGRKVDYVLMARMLEPTRPFDFFFVPASVYAQSNPRRRNTADRLRRYRYTDPQRLKDRFAAISKRAGARLEDVRHRDKALRVPAEDEAS